MANVVLPTQCWECGWGSDDPTFFYPYPWRDNLGINHYCSVCWTNLTGTSPVVYNNTPNQPEELKETQMETYELTDVSVMPAEYNPHQVVVYAIKEYGQLPQWGTAKVTDLEYELQVGRNARKTMREFDAKVSQLNGIICEAYENSGDKDTLGDIAELFDIELTKTISYTAGITVSGSIEVPLGEYDLDSIIYNGLNVDSDEFDIDTWSVDTVDEG